MLRKALCTVLSFVCATSLLSAEPLAEKKVENKAVLILLGPPGSGKGSQAVMIKEKTNLAHISTGDLLREHVKNQTELGKNAKGYMDKGELVPDALIFDMLFKRVAEPDCEKGYILDGFPRTVAQAEHLHQKLGQEHKITVVNLNVPDNILIDRIAKRQLKENRADDSKEIVMNRLSVYHKQTAPVIDYYKKAGKLESINGDQAKEMILEKVCQILNK